MRWRLEGFPFRKRFKGVQMAWGFCTSKRLGRKWVLSPLNDSERDTRDVVGGLDGLTRDPFTGQIFSTKVVPFP